MLGHHLALALRGAYLAMHRTCDAHFARAGVTADQFVVLAALAPGEALTQRELVARTSSDPNTLRAMLVLLEQQGLVQRRPHPTDGRARSVALTRRGRRTCESLWTSSEPLRQRLLAACGHNEAQRLIDNLHRIIAAMNAAGGPPTREPPVPRSSRQRKRPAPVPTQETL